MKAPLWREMNFPHFVDLLVLHRRRKKHLSQVCIAIYRQIEVNPHELKRNAQRDKYLWYAAYETTLFQGDLMRILKNTDDPALPMVNALLMLTV